jgi:hypothetical protein
MRPSHGDRLGALVADEFGDQPIDLVVDDAAHLLGPTRVSFTALFPHVRPGEVHVIEDGSWHTRLEVALVPEIAVDPTRRERLDEKACARGRSTRR